MNYLKPSFYGALGLLSLSACSGEQDAKEAHAKKPNVLLILADDMGWSDLGCYGSTIETPHLDSLAGEGIRFTQFYNTAKSFPSRACLLTGLYAHQSGMNTAPEDFEAGVTIAQVLKKEGYRTLMAGKHHGTDNPVDFGFDRYYGLRDGACNFFNPGDQRQGEGPPAHKTWAYPRTWCIDDSVVAPYTPKQEDFYTTDYFTHYALDYLQEYEDETKPFFLYLSYTAPHAPLQAWPGDIKKYEGQFMKSYEAQRKARYKRQQEMGLIDERFPLSEGNHYAWDTLTKREKELEARRMAVYAAMIDRMDQNIGRVLDELRRQGELANTLILFASDNGASPAMLPEDLDGFNATADSGEIGSMTHWGYQGWSLANVSNTPFRYFKSWAHHGGSCTPLIASWEKGIEGKNRISDFAGHFIDFMPTILEVTGASYPDSINGQPVPNMEGKSFAPVFKEEYTPKRKLFWKYRGGRAVRHGHWRLVSDHKGPGGWNIHKETTPGWRLYDLRTDITETKDVSARHPEVVDSLKTLYKAWKTRTGLKK